MSRIAFFLFAVFTSFPYGSAFAGNHNVTKHFRVNGVCEQCKTRIEAAAYVKGVKYAEWNIDTQDLAIKYDSTKTTPRIFLKSIASSGHDNELYKAENEDYEKIAKCCKYRSDIKKH